MESFNMGDGKTQAKSWALGAQENLKMILSYVQGKRSQGKMQQWVQGLNTGENNPSLLLGLFLYGMSSHLAVDSISIVQGYSPHTRLNSWHLGPAQARSLNSKGGWGEHQEFGEKRHGSPLRLATSQVQGSSL